MVRKKLPIDKVRASRDGHEFHEAWAARKALQLLLPIDRFVGIAVEGLSPLDESPASAETVEIADLVLFYGKYPAFSKSEKVVVLQFKYSIGLQDVSFRQSDAKKTIEKFAVSYRDHKKRHGSKIVKEKLRFELITNRAIDPALFGAIKGISTGSQVRGDAAKQAKQFKSASGLRGKELATFAEMISIVGLAGSLRHTKQAVSRTLVDWSAAPDALSRARLGNLKQLVRDKAGSAGRGNNLITETDVLAALELQEPEDLLPCPDSFPRIGPVVIREQLKEVINLIPTLQKPLLIHADGGVGKTVFMQSLAKIMSRDHQVVLFDCFGGGAYRAPEDARHLPKRGLIHIVNSLACTGLCDPLLPLNENVEELIKAFRKRLSQAVETLQREFRGKQLLLFLDAIDNAAEHANDKSEPCFPKLLLESFHHSGAIPGSQIIATCRSYRIAISKGEAECEEKHLRPFSESEAKKYLLKRIKNLTNTELRVAFARSGGNPRILEHLALSNRGLLDSSEINKVVQLDDLLRTRIQEALRDALSRGYKMTQIESFLAGLSVLPPPVPVADYADAHGMAVSAILSFAADLAPLLERTKYGMMFRDEPTETFIRRNYAAKSETLRLLANNLFESQNASVYAARALPGLLQKLDDGEFLFRLAFDERFPVSISSTVAKREIRFARIASAVMHAARHNDSNRLVHLLIELSMIAAVNQRGSEFIINNPDLVIASGELSATRRLFEARTKWPGTRHSRLAIANALSGDFDEAERHAIRAYEWIRHYYRQNDDYHREMRGPERIDVAAITFCLIIRDRAKDAVTFLKTWKNWYAFEVCEHLFALLAQAETTNPAITKSKERFLEKGKTDIAVLSAALSFQEVDAAIRRRLVGYLSKLCVSCPAIEFPKQFYPTRRYRLQDGLLKAAATALLIGSPAKSFSIMQLVPEARPDLWAFNDRFSAQDVLPFLLTVAVRSAARGEVVSERETLPTELFGLDIKNHQSTDFHAYLKEVLEARYKAGQDLPNDKKIIKERTRRDATQFIDQRMQAIIDITRALSETISADSSEFADKFLRLLDCWARTREERSQYSAYSQVNRFLDNLGRELVLFVLWTRPDIEPASAGILLATFEKCGVTAPSILIELVWLFAKRSHLQHLSGACAVKTVHQIELENDIEARSSFFAQLSRGILPASKEEAAGYFQKALEQLDAIGSGDYTFTNELLIFSASLKGTELDDGDFHILTNICELNIPEEPEKFPWPAFAQGLSKVAGCKVLAKLARWDDRSKIDLDYTLMPCLMALLKDRKIEPEIALSLLRLCSPAELYGYGSEQFADIIRTNEYPNGGELVGDLIRQHLENNPGTMGATIENLHTIARKLNRVPSDITAYLSAAGQHFTKINDERNENANYHGMRDPIAVEIPTDDRQDNRQDLRELASGTTVDQESISRALDSVESTAGRHGSKARLLELIRDSVKFSQRAAYIQAVAHLPNLDIHTKLHELEACKNVWSTSSGALGRIYSELGIPLVQIHSEDFISYDSLYGWLLSQVSRLVNLSMHTLALELTKIFATSSFDVGASVWLGLASIICDEVIGDDGRSALKRLLNSNAARLSSSVEDGEWNDRLYPVSDSDEIAAGLIWFRLGSPTAANRWRGAHSLRSLARFGKWSVIHAVVSKIYATDAGSFQAPELPFYYLHARLWLLVAIARIANDEPKQISKYERMLSDFALSNTIPHVLLRHFAANAILTCAAHGASTLPTRDLQRVKAIGASPFRVVKRKAQQYRSDSLYSERPKEMPKPALEFSLDYDFHKYDVANLSELFDRSGWEIKDSITKWVRSYDDKISSMYEAGGRKTRGRRYAGDMGDEYHLYGQQLGWHALFLVAGELLAMYPVILHPYDSDESDPWQEWKARKILTREDGLWLADGTDLPPIETKVNLLEKSTEGLVVTGNKGKLLELIGIRFDGFQELVISASWPSSDGIDISISTALAAPQEARRLAQELSQEDPFQAWLPQADNEDGPMRNKKPGLEGWIVNSTKTLRLDEYDPIAASSAVSRPRFSEEIRVLQSLRRLDPFGRFWSGADGDIVAHSEAWRIESYRSEGLTQAVRFSCTTDLLKGTLSARQSDLLLLLILRKYEKESQDTASKFFHTTAVIHFTPSLDFEFHLGAVNQLHQSKW
jgi:NACHT domain-containing protein